MSPILIVSFAVMLVFAVWAVFGIVRWTPERGTDNNWYESGIGRRGGVNRTFTN